MLLHVCVHTACIRAKHDGCKRSGDTNMTFWGVTDGEWWSTALKAHLDHFRPEGHPLGANINSYYPRPVF
ncbi:hypothetical protein LJC21_02225, partial [Bacteroides sp. OttesenSCG-928-E20]|nr:hypothetical protein [Bacteroides sp. OttesenSCG-928-E20]